MSNRPTYKVETGFNAADNQRMLDPQVVLSNARATFETPEISAALVEIANKLKNTPEGIQGYSIARIEDMLRKTGVVIDTSMSIAIAGILADRGTAANEESFSIAA